MGTAEGEESESLRGRGEERDRKQQRKKEFHTKSSLFPEHAAQKHSNEASR